MKNERLKLFGFIFILLIGILFISSNQNDSSLELPKESNKSILTSFQNEFIYYKNSNKSDSSILNVDSLSNHVIAANNISASVNGDLVTITSPNIKSFSVNVTQSYNSAKNITTYGGINSNGKGVISLKNGTYYFFGVNPSNMTTVKSGAVRVTGSCKNETKTNQTGTFTVERCFLVDKSGNAKAETGGNIATCANGYTFSNSKVITNTCSTNLNGLSRRYCKVVYQATCQKNAPSGGNSGGSSSTKPTTVAAAKLSALSVSSGSLSPAFKSGTTKYSVTVGSNVGSIKVNATVASGSKFVSGMGSRTVNLNYGTNTIKVQVKNSAGKVTTYTIIVTRPDGRSSVNTLSNLRVDFGTLSPAFSSNVTNYTLDVDSALTSITVSATLTDSNSKFADGFGPKTYDLQPGPNKIYVKVVSQKGEINVYNITVNRATEPSECTTDTENLALLKQIDLTVDLNDLTIDPIENFDSKTFTYSDIKIPYKVTNLTVTPYVETEGDTYIVENADDLEVGENREIKITVTSKKCPSYSNVYTLNVQRQPEVTLGDNAELKNITIANHDEFTFEPNVLKYNLILNKGEKQLDITYEKELETTQCDISGNEDLGYSSEVTLRCVSEDGEDIAEYVITIDGVQKGTNLFLVIVLVIIIIIILIYLVLRLLGYRIYFNFSVFGSFFKGIGEKIKNIFDK